MGPIAMDYGLEKEIWTTADFEQMGWHDSHVFAVAFRPEDFELWIDLDYVFEWVKPDNGGTYFRFWVSPCTMVFKNIHDLKFDLDSMGDLEIVDVRRENPKRPRNAKHIGAALEWAWDIECQEGLISVTSIGFEQYVRKAPQLILQQKLELNLRGGISFGREMVR